MALERVINRLRHRQATLLREADADQSALADGCRTLAEWTAGRLDVSRATARSLVALARIGAEDEAPPESFDRTVATSRLAAAGSSEQMLDRSRGHDIETVWAMAGRHRRLTAAAERDGFASRYVTLQPALDESHWSLSGRLPAVDGAAVSLVLDATADGFPTLPDGTREDRAARRADALVQHVTVGHNTGGNGDGSSVSSQVTVFVDARDGAQTNGESGAWVVSGPRVGPATLEQLLCESTVAVVALAEDGTPFAVGPSTAAIPARTRDLVRFRDHGMCSADGCRSRYRLQPHHIVPRSQGGTNEPDNLTSLCWHHHHAVVHRRGFTIDPTSPPGRRRFQPPPARDPPS